MTIIEKLKRLWSRPFDDSLDPERQVDNTDAVAAVSSGADRLDPQGGTGHGGAPPGYVKTDDGRPRH